ncbi:SRPBCC family protein [Demetria terragena]|uniref:SRPBCC family protein n=1 Tax=Demetria terragena TaxID=63959 RepID=UPI00035C93E1|nr:SRPBCC family protein [Demetria terragena]
MTPTTDRISTARIEADENLPIIHITRDFHASGEQLIRAHTDPEIFTQWVGPKSIDTEVVEWDARTGGSYRYLSRRGEEAWAFRGCFHTIRPDRLVQTFTWEEMPDGVSLDTMTFEDLGDGWTRMHSVSLLESPEARDGMLASGMESGINDGYAKLDELITGGTL